MRAGSLALIFLFFVSGCRASAARGSVVTPREALKINWSAEDLQKPIAVRFLRKTPQASFHIIRLKGAEKPHRHVVHDLSVFMISGRARVHLGKLTYEMRAGDVAEIPQGTLHWAESLASEGSEVYAVFTPPYDGKDFVEAADAAVKSSSQA